REVRVRRRRAWVNEAAGVLSDVGSVGCNGTDKAQTHDVCRRSASRGGVIRCKRINVGRIGCQQILKVDLETIADVHSQGDRARTLAWTQLHVAGNQALRRVDSHDVALECVDHTGWVDHAETV